MKASKFSDAQKAFILRQGADGVPVADICRKAGISQATYFNWKKKYDGMQPPETTNQSLKLPNGLHIIIKYVSVLSSVLAAAQVSDRPNKLRL
jgi:transposase-like protein